MEAAAPAAVKKPHAKSKSKPHDPLKASKNKHGKHGKHGHARKHKKRAAKEPSPPPKSRKFGCCAKKKKQSAATKTRKHKTKQPTHPKKKVEMGPPPEEDIGDIVLVKPGTPNQKLDPRSAEFIPAELRPNLKPPPPMPKPEEKIDKSKEVIEPEKRKPEERIKSKEDDREKNLSKEKEVRSRESAENASKEKERKSKEVLRSDKDIENGKDGKKLGNELKESSSSKDNSGPVENMNQQKEKWQKLARQINKDDASVPEMEFENVAGYVPHFVSKRHFVKNMHKNRFADVVCMDHSRVSLNDGTYIHANYVPVDGDKTAIATQLPLPNTASDFWQMVIEKKVKAVVLLLTDLEYESFGGDFVFPRNQDFIMFSGRSIRVGDFRQIEIQKGWTLRVLSVTNGDYKSYLHVHHFKTWPHDGVPKSLKSVWQLQSVLRKYASPVIYMSLSGCGRAGTYALLENAHSSLHSDSPTFSLEICLQKVRNGRLHAVQNVTQYSFVYALIAEHVLGNGIGKLIKGCGDEPVEEDLHKILKQLTINQN